MCDCQSASDRLIGPKQRRCPRHRTRPVFRGCSWFRDQTPLQDSRSLSRFRAERALALAAGAAALPAALLQRAPRPHPRPTPPARPQVDQRSGDQRCGARRGSRAGARNAAEQAEPFLHCAWGGWGRAERGVAWESAVLLTLAARLAPTANHHGRRCTGLLGASAGRVRWLRRSPPSLPTPRCAACPPAPRARVPARPRLDLVSGRIRGRRLPHTQASPAECHPAAPHSPPRPAQVRRADGDSVCGAKACSYAP